MKMIVIALYLSDDISRKEDICLKRTFVLLSYILLLLFVFPVLSQAESNSIQQQIDKANAGDTLHISEGIYEENIVIDKSITIIGENVTLQNDSSDPIISIQADEVVLEHINFQYESTERGIPAILIQGESNELKQLIIETNSFGIRLDEANNNEISDVTIKGQKEIPLNERQAGIDLWLSNNNSIHHNDITDVEDGIYAESSEGNEIHHNIVTDSRYGYHLMFTKDTLLEHNESYENISGMMVMGTNETKVNENIIKYNQKNVQSLGILLFDEKDTTVTHNDIAHNRIGILLEGSKDNTIASNIVHNNFIGIQFKQAENNTITNNVFTANVVQGQAEKSTDNDTDGNYWGDHVGLDMTGDYTSDIAYEIDPFYLNLTNEYPPYRLFFSSPGMLFLEQLLHTPAEERFTDLSPLMENPLTSTSQEEENETNVLLVSSMFLTISIVMIIMGVRRK